MGPGTNRLHVHDFAYIIKEITETLKAICIFYKKKNTQNPLHSKVKKKFLCIEYTVLGIVLCALYVLSHLILTTQRKEEAEAQFHEELI